MSNQTWNLSPLLQSDTDPYIEQEQQQITQAIDTFVQKWESQTDYIQNPRFLSEALHEYNHLMTTLGTSGKAGYYFSLRRAQDQTDATIKAQSQKIADFSIAQSNKIQFFEIRLSQIKKDAQQLLLHAPELSEFKHYLERIFVMQPHILSEPEERILNLKDQTSCGKWIHMTSSLLSKETRSITVDGHHRELSFEELLKVSSFHQDENTRDTATTHLNDILNKLADVAENEINAILQDKKINDELRGYTRPDQARHLSDDIDTPVVDAMLNAVASHNNLAHRFYALKAKMLGKTKLKYNERNLEINKIKITYNWEQSIKIIDKVFKNLDPQFSHIFNSMLKNGQFDIFPRKGKKGGAFCAGNLISHPTYVLLNHTDKLNDVLTLAHEMGHAINNELMKQAVNALNYNTPLSTAEVASTFMEDFVLQELEKSADAHTKKALLMQKLNDDISTIFRQVACYKFEQSLHAAFRQKGYLSKDEIGELFQKNMSAYMGEAVEQPDWAKNWWIYWSHIRSFFYVYSYASGLLISKAMQNMVKQNPSAIAKVKTFLSAGTSDSPKNIFAKMGIDIVNAEFWNLGLNEIAKSLQRAEQLI